MNRLLILGLVMAVTGGGTLKAQSNPLSGGPWKGLQEHKRLFHPGLRKKKNARKTNYGFKPIARRPKFWPAGSACCRTTNTNPRALLPRVKPEKAGIYGDREYAVQEGGLGRRAKEGLSLSVMAHTRR